MMAVVAILIGLTTGVISGLIGLGGGVFIVPALVYVFKMSQHEAQGTSLATLLLPIGLLVSWSTTVKAMSISASPRCWRSVSQWACSQGDDGRRRFQTSCCAVYSRSRSSWSRRACGLSVD
jgi:hypothetical protein